MFNSIIYFYFMVINFMMMYIMSMILYYLDLSILMEWMILELNSLNMEFIILVDWISLLFVSVVLLISSMIMVYSYMYMNNNNFINRFFWLIILFILSMILMIISPNLVSIMFGWDGLGLVSYCLVIFYQNYLSFNSGMITVLCNRVGDVGFLMLIGLMMMKGGWSIYLFEESNLIMFMLMLAVLTKSAQIPFSSWLPAAMAAPTPVSALVHSSTLVTAGVYLFIRFNKFFMIFKEVKFSMLYLATFTMLISGIMAIVEVDLKKIIALSTLSQLGLMMTILSVGGQMIGYYHLLTHAIFKSMMFMCAGIFIHFSMNNQDIRLLGGLSEYLPFTMMVFLISMMALCGFPFLAGFYSKDLIMEVMFNIHMNFYLLMFIIFSYLLTVLYSLRLFYYIFYSEVKFYSYLNIQENKVMNFSMLILMVLSIIIGSMISWLFFCDSYMLYLKLTNKILPLMVCFFSIIVGLKMKMCVFKKVYCLFMYFSSMWFLNYLYVWVYSPVNLLGSHIFKVDLKWVEFLSQGTFFFLVKYIKYYFMYKMYMFIYWFLIIFFLFYLLF